jgi:hypothetical protein
MALTIGDGSYAAPKKPPKPPTLSLAPTAYPSNTVGAAAANNGYAGIAAAFPSFTAPASTPGIGATGIQAPSDTSALTGGTNYATQLADDPILAATRQAVSAQGATNQANLTAQRRQALAQFGYIPANLSGQLQGDVNSDVDQLTRQLADAATAGGTSTYAQLQKAYADQQKSDWASLAARNMVHSGAAGQHANEDLTAYQQGYASSVQKLIDYLQSAYQTYLTAQATGQQSLADATNQALQRIIAQIQAGQYQAAQQAAAQPSGGGGGGDYSGIVAPDYTGSSNPAVVAQALQAPGAVNALGGPAPWANALQTVTAPKKTAVKPYQPLVGRDY